MRGGVFRLLSAAAALPAVGALRARGVRSSAVEDLRSLCGGGRPPADLVERGLDCDPEIPHYDMDEWIARHGKVAPDHPAVFVGTHTSEAQVFPDMETFLARHGDSQVVALPEYSTAGSTVKDPNAKGRVNATFRTLLDTWNDTHAYFSDFKCLEDSLCEGVARQFGVPELFKTESLQSRNFLVGGPDSGLPFHKHGMTWQSLAMGRKAWYMLPAGSMSEELHDATGPYIYPVRAFHHLMQQRTLGARPLYCVQHPGEVLFIPHYWWHSTMNLDRYQVAYGEKPRMAQLPSIELQLIMSHFPAQAYDSAGASPQQGSGAEGDENPMAYTLVPRENHQKRQCSAGGLDDPTYGLELPLSRLRGLAGSTLMQCGLAESAAWVHCMMASFSWGPLRRNCSSRLDTVALRNFRLDMAKHSLRWKREALQLSQTLFERENSVCGTRAALAKLEDTIRQA